MAETLTNTRILDTEGKPQTVGEIRIADEVVAIIAGLAATEVEGVHTMAGDIPNALISKLGMKNLSKGVKVEISDKQVSVKVALNVNYNAIIPEVSKKVQERIKTAIENMTGLQVSEVNVSIAGVSV